MFPHFSARRGEIILEAAAIVAGLPGEAIINLGRMLSPPAGGEQLAHILAQLGRLRPAERNDLLAELDALTRLRLHVG